MTITVVTISLHFFYIKSEVFLIKIQVSGTGIGEPQVFDRCFCYRVL
jgi:hypothetical protein